jgi:hypothetical protein
MSASRSGHSRSTRDRRARPEHRRPAEQRQSAGPVTQPRAAAAAVPVTSGAIRRGRGGSDLLFICLGGIALIQLQGRMAPRHLQEAGQALVQLRSVDFTVLAEAPPTVAAAAMALLGPLLMRLPWQAGLALTGLAWIMLVGLALHLERAAEVAFDVLPPAIGLAGTLMLALGLQRRLQQALDQRPEKVRVLGQDLFDVDRPGRTLLHGHGGSSPCER